MIEHLSREDSVYFLNEAFRVLAPGGILRIALPDLKLAINSYFQTQEADIFMEKILLAPPPINTKNEKFLYFLQGIDNISGCMMKNLYLN